MHRASSGGSSKRRTSASEALIAHHYMSQAIATSPPGVKGILKSPPFKPAAATMNKTNKRVRFAVSTARSCGYAKFSPLDGF